jgi:hypothetical protein
VRGARCRGVRACVARVVGCGVPRCGSWGCPVSWGAGSGAPPGSTPRGRRHEGVRVDHRVRPPIPCGDDPARPLPTGKHPPVRARPRGGRLGPRLVGSAAKPPERPGASPVFLGSAAKPPRAAGDAGPSAPPSRALRRSHPSGRGCGSVSPAFAGSAAKPPERPGCRPVFLGGAKLPRGRGGGRQPRLPGLRGEAAGVARGCGGVSPHVLFPPAGAWGQRPPTRRSRKLTQPGRGGVGEKTPPAPRVPLHRRGPRHAPECGKTPRPPRPPRAT